MHARGSGAELGDLLSAVDPDQLAGTERRMFDLIQTDFSSTKGAPGFGGCACADYSKSHRAGPRPRPRMMCPLFAHAERGCEPGPSKGRSVGRRKHTAL